ncbi:MAG: patatin-like phospholipase family protein [Candidatus Nanoarchaeia archaeon]|nr:patatin-like phospholipase family protein [Candidatus Nanoarchaeia archaeon]
MQIILSLDTGGMRGITQIVILNYIEQKIQEILGDKRIKLINVVDLITGTSSSSFIAGLMLIPSENFPWGKFSMQEILEIYLKVSKNIFKKKLLYRIKTLWGFRGPKYPDDNLEMPLFIQIDHYKLKDLLKTCLFIGYDINQKKVNIYTNNDSKCNDYYLKDIIRGSLTIPAYFNPAYFRDGVNINTIIDGGLLGSNPSILAFSELIKTTDPKDILMISIGAGKSSRAGLIYNKVKKWGKNKWYLHLIDIILSASSEISHYELESIFKSIGKSENYKRLNGSLFYSHSSQFDVSKENLTNLYKDAKEYVELNKDCLDDIAKRISENSKFMKMIEE